MCLRLSYILSKSTSAIDWDQVVLVFHLCWHKLETLKAIPDTLAKLTLNSNAWAWPEEGYLVCQVWMWRKLSVGKGDCANWAGTFLLMWFPPWKDFTAPILTAPLLVNTPSIARISLERNALRHEPYEPTWYKSTDDHLVSNVLTPSHQRLAESGLCCRTGGAAHPASSKSQHTVLDYEAGQVAYNPIQLGDAALWESGKA